MEKNFVIFYCPGTFVAETVHREIDTWDVPTAVGMSKDVVARYNATPYGFCFVTHSRKDGDMVSSEVDRSPMYYLGGEVETLAELKEKNRPEDAILISNMEINEKHRVIVNKNSYEWTSFLGDNDVVLDMENYNGKTSE